MRILSKSQLKETVFKLAGKQDLLLFSLILLILFSIQFYRLSDPFFNDEVIYTITNFSDASVFNFIPFSKFYISQTGHPPFLNFISYLVHISELPYAVTLRVIYLLNSGLFLLGLIKVSQLLFQGKAGLFAYLPSLLTLIHPLFYTQSIMILGNIPEATCVIFSLYFFLLKDYRKLALILLLGAVLRESFIGVVLVLFLWDEDKLKNLKFFISPILYLIFFYISEVYLTGTFLNHSYASEHMDHGNFHYTYSNFFKSIGPLISIFPNLTWSILPIGIFTLFNEYSNLRYNIFVFISLSIPAFLFFIPFGDTQARDFFWFVPSTIMLLVYLLSKIKRTIYSLIITFVFSALTVLDYQNYRDKGTPRYREFYKSYQRVLDFLDENQHIKNNLTTHYPFQFTFTQKKLGIIGDRSPIEMGNKIYLITEFQQNMKIVYEERVIADHNKFIRIYKKEKVDE